MAISLGKWGGELLDNLRQLESVREVSLVLMETPQVSDHLTFRTHHISGGRHSRFPAVALVAF
jgi:hypothetical protein